MGAVVNKKGIAVLNLSDGVITTYGYLLALVIRTGHINKHEFVVGAFGAGISMAIGQRLEDMTSDEPSGWGDFFTALGASIVGSFIPPLAYFFFNSQTAAIVTFILTAMAVIVVAETLTGYVGRVRAWANVVGLFSIGIGLEFLLSL